MAEAQRVRLPLRARERRSHAERAAATRGRIVAAVLESYAALLRRDGRKDEADAFARRAARIKGVGKQGESGR